MKKNRIKWLAPIVIIIVAVVIFIGLKNAKKEVEKKPIELKPSLVETQPVQAKNWQFKIRSQGLVSPLQQTQLTAQVSAKVIELADVFIEGGFFEQGQILVKLESSDYQTEVKSAQAALASAQAALKEEKARGEVAKQEWKQLPNKATDLALRIPQLETAQANVVYAQAQLERAQRNLDRTLIRAPYAGVVVSRSAQLGQYLQMGSPIGLIYSTDVAEIRLPVTLADLEFIALRQNAVQTAPTQVNLMSKMAGLELTWQAKLVRSEGIVDKSSRMIYLVAQLNDPYNITGQHKHAIHFGQFVEANILGKHATQLFRVKRDLLTVNQALILVDNEQKIHLIKPEIVRAEQEYIYIRSGLNNGDLIVTTALSNPVEGMPVRTHSSKEAL